MIDKKEEIMIVYSRTIGSEEEMKIFKDYCKVMKSIIDLDDRFSINKKLIYFQDQDNLFMEEGSRPRFIKVSDFIDVMMIEVDLNKKYEPKLTFKS